MAKLLSLLGVGAGAAAGGGGSFVTWELATVASVTLSGGNLVATNTGTTSANQGAHVVFTSGKTTGKHYFEITWTAIQQAGGNYGFGVGTTASSYTGLGGSATVGTILYRGGSTYANSSLANSGAGSWTAGQTTSIAVDLDNRKFWTRNAAGGNWNSSGANDPATNVGGILIPAGTIVPFCVFGGSGGLVSNVLTANFGSSSFTGAVPSGFTSGWTV